MWPQAGTADLLSAMACTHSARAGPCMAMMARRGSRQTIRGPIVGGRSVAQISPVIMWARSGSDLTAYYETHEKQDK